MTNNHSFLSHALFLYSEFLVCRKVLFSGRTIAVSVLYSLPLFILSLHSGFLYTTCCRLIQNSLARDILSRYRIFNSFVELTKELYFILLHGCQHDHWYRLFFEVWMLNLRGEHVWSFLESLEFTVQTREMSCLSIKWKKHNYYFKSLVMD